MKRVLPDLSGLRWGRLRRAHLGRVLQRQQVEESAACARALTALYGSVPEVEVLPGGASRIPRALLTGRVLQDQPACPWPAAMMRQLDPDDPAFLPPLGLHPVLAARDRTLLGLPDRGAPAWVDPHGWCGQGDGPSVTVWFGDARSLWLVGPRPDESGAVVRPGPGGQPAQVEISQCRGKDGVGVITRCRRGALSLELTHFPVVIEGQVAWALRARITMDGPAPRPVRLVFALRPAGIDGVAPIFHLQRDDNGLWSADGAPLLAVDQRGEEVLTANHGQPDPWLRLAGLARGGPPRRPGAVSCRCPAGLASGAEVYRTTIFPGEPVSRLAVIAPPRSTAQALVHTSSQSLWAGAQADRRGLLRSGCELHLRRHDNVLEAARQRLLIEPGLQQDDHLKLGGLLGAVALARLGFFRRAGDRLSAGLSQVRRDGSLAPSAGPEIAAVLAWAAAQHLLWTDVETTAMATRLSWVRLVDRLVDTQPQPGGFGLFGSRGSCRWSAIWRAAALVACASVLRDRSQVARSDDVTRWGLAGAAACEQLDDLLGDGPWTSDQHRVHDGSAAAMLAAVWLGVIAPDHRGVAPTLAALREHHWHGGGVLLRGGAHVAATSLLVAAAERAEPGSDYLDIIAALASPTGALPMTRHPTRGAVGEGDDLLSAALFVLLAVERVQASRGVLRVLSEIAQARRLPTPYGLIDVDGDTVTGTWRGQPPTIERDSFSEGS